MGGAGEPEALDLRFAKAGGDQGASFRRLLAWGTPTIAVVAAVVPFFHIGAVLVIPLVLAIHLVVARVVLVRDAQRLLGPVRRLLGRWTHRLAFLWVGIPGYGAMTVPFLGVVVGAGTFVVLTTVVHVSTLVALQRERAKEPLAGWEKAVPMVLAVVTAVVLILAISLAVIFGWTMAAIAERMQAQ